MNMDTGDIIFYIYELVVISGLVFGLIFKQEERLPPIDQVEILGHLQQQSELIQKLPEILHLQQRKLPSSKLEYQELFQEILTWCQRNIKLGKERKVRPNIKVSFKISGNMLGYYQYSTQTIMVYVLKNESLKGCVQTFIHEYVHFLQIRTTKDNLRYNSLSRRKGYYDNDYEVEAREIALNHIEDCIKDLKF